MLSLYRTLFPHVAALRWASLVKNARQLSRKGSPHHQLAVVWRHFRLWTDRELTFLEHFRAASSSGKFRHIKAWTNVLVDPDR